MPIADAQQTSPIEVVRGLEGVPDLADKATNQRVREVWTRDEWRRFNRAAKIMEEHGVKMRLLCTLAQCPDKNIRIHPDASAPSGAVLRCGCTDRIFARGYR